MEIQSIYGANKTTPAAAASSDEDTGAANGFAALLAMVGTQFKETLGIGMDPVVIKADAKPEVEAPEPRDTKKRPERSDEKDAKAKPADEDSESDETQTEDAAAADDQKSNAADAGANTQTGQQQQAAQAAVAAVVDAALMTQTTTVAPTVAVEAAVEASTETVVAKAEGPATEMVAADAVVKTAEIVVEAKAAVQTDVKAAAKVVAPEAVAKETGRVQQTVNAYAPTEESADDETAPVEVEASQAEVKTSAKESAMRTLDVRSAAAQEQANSLARLLGSENKIQVQVSTTPAHAAKQTIADVSIYNIYSGYTAADAISLANGQFGQGEESNAVASSPAPRTEGTTQAAVAAQVALAAQPTTSANANSAGSTPVRADAVAPTAIQASAPSGGAANANMGFSAFTQGGQSSGTQQTQQAAQPNPTDRPAATAQQVIDQIKVNITKAAKAGLDRVTIQLKPVELGRIEIKLEMSEDHKVRVTVTADSKDTLNLLQTDSRTLERTLNDAGLRTDANNLHFNLRSESDPRSADGQNGQGPGRNGANDNTQTAAETPEPQYDYAAAAYARGGIDTFA